MGSEWARIFERFDGTLSWGAGRAIAFLGGAAPPATEGGSVAGTRGSPSRGPLAWSSFNGGEAATEPLMHTPAWAAPVVPSGAPKASGGASLLPPPTSNAGFAFGRHEYHVAWVAVQDSDFARRRCTAADGDGCKLGRDASPALRGRFSKPNVAAGGMCGSKHEYARRPAFLAFGARASFVQFYGGARSRAGRVSRRRYTKDDHYIDLDGNADSAAPGGVPASAVSRLHEALRWLLLHHERENISVAAISVLTSARFEADPVGHPGLAATLRELRRAGVLVVANGGNCRGWWPNCTGLPWPAIAEGVTPVGAATFGEGVTDHANALTTSLDAASCEVPMYAVCGAIFTSAAVAAFAAGLQLLLEAIEVSGYQWQRRSGAAGTSTVEASSKVEAALAVVRATAAPLRPSYKVGNEEARRIRRCSRNRYGLRLEAALDHVLAHRGPLGRRGGRLTAGSPP